jgi:uncharacterized protein YceK
MRRVAPGLCVLAAVLGVGGCGDVETTSQSTPGASVTWATYQADVTSVAPGPNAREMSRFGPRCGTAEHGDVK